MAQILYRLGRFGARRPRIVLLVWPLVVAAVVFLSFANAGSFEDSNEIPGSAAVAASDEMDRHWPESGNQTGTLVVQTPAGTSITDPPIQKAVQSELERAAGITGVLAVSDPFADGPVSEDGRTAVVQFELDTPEDVAVPASTVKALEGARDAVRAAGTTAVLAGDAFGEEAPPVGPAEGVGVLVAMVILILTFGSLLAAGLPLLIALIGVALNTIALIGLSSLFGISDAAPTLSVMIGLAVGIDYALFIVSRHRAQLADGMPVKESVATATATAGSAVTFAGATVIIALCGLSVAGVPILTSMGLASAGAVAVAVLTSLTLLPALLAVAGKRLVPSPTSRAGRRHASHGAPVGKPAFGVRWVTAVSRRPVVAIVSVVAGLLLLAAPALQLKTALSDDGSEPTSNSARQSYDTVAEAFGPGANGPLVVLVTGASPDVLESAAADTAAELAGMKGVADVSRVDTADDGEAARIRVTPTTGPRDPATSELVDRINAAVAPLANSSGAELAVTGQTAVSIDVTTKLTSALVPFSLVVVGLSLLLLLVAFRSIAVPIKATVGFLLSIAASLGATVAVFQWGWLAELLGVPSTGPIASHVPIMVMAVLFGLAMDYEVFLVSSMREDYVRSRDARGSVISGARHSARVVTAAALIMVAVFVSFLFSHDPDIKPIALALGVGVLVDAFLVRMTLVPAVLTLLGDRAWWLPRWLDRILPNVDVEGGHLERPLPAARAAGHDNADDGAAQSAPAGQDVLA